MVGVLGKGSKDLSLARIDFLLLRRKAIPLGNTVWSLRHLRSFWNDAGFDLVLEIALTENVPALIKLAFVFRDPLRANMVRRVGTS